jgi:hypothetical protein
MIARRSVHMLEVENLTIDVGGREIIHDVSFSIDIEGLSTELGAQMQHAIEMSERELL